MGCANPSGSARTKSSRFTCSAAASTCFVADGLRAQPDVLLQGSGEQVRVLQHHAELAAEVQRIELPHIHAADADGALSARRRNAAAG